MTQHERLLACLRYDPENGFWVRLRDGGGRRAGEIAGHLRKDGYRRIGFEGNEYLEHRLAIFCMTSAWPRNEVDHRNLNRADNRWANLREATHSQNRTNTRPTSSSGFKGVTWHRDGKWQAQLGLGKTNIYLGLFDSKEAAHAAYRTAASRLFGEFARTE